MKFVPMSANQPLLTTFSGVVNRHAMASNWRGRRGAPS